MIRTSLFTWEPGPYFQLQHHVHTDERLTRRSITLRTWCGCRLNRSLRKDKAPLDEKDALRAAHAEIREAHLAEVQARVDAIRAEIRKKCRR